MTVVLMVQMAVNQVINMITVGNRFMTAIRTVNMAGIMPFTFVAVSAVGGILAGHIQGVFIYMIAMHMMQMTIVKIVNMVAVLDGGVSTVGSVLMFMVIVCLAFLHANLRR